MYSLRFPGLASLLLLAACLAAGPALADIVEKDVEGIRNYSSYTGEATFAGDKVGFGGATDAQAMAWLKGQGYATVINLRGAEEEGADVDAERKAAEDAGIRYIHLPFDPENPAADMDARFQAAAGDPANQPVYIHCGSATRAAALWMTARSRLDGVDKASAESEGRLIAEKPDKAIGIFESRVTD